MHIAVLGATGKTGRYLVARLCAAGYAVTAVGRDAGRLGQLDSRARPALADLDAPDGLSAALEGADCVVNLAHARFTAALLGALPRGCARVVNVGSTRKFSRLPDAAAEAVRAGERLFLASGRTGVMLHASMIYGPPDERNVGRILRLVRRWPARLPLVLPLPDGGRHFVQPIFVDDMVAALVGAIERPQAPGPPIVAAGPVPITYAAMVRAAAAALDRRAHVLPVPAGALAAALGIAAAVGLRPPFDAAEMRRAGEDKRHDPAEMERRLGVRPRPFEEGLALKLARGWL